jgi:hypothetical protein
VELCILVSPLTLTLYFLSQYLSTCENISLTHPCCEANSRVIWQPCEKGYKKTGRRLPFVFTFLPRTSKCFLSCSLPYCLPYEKQTLVLLSILQVVLLNQLYSNEKHRMTLLRLFSYFYYNVHRAEWSYNLQNLG